MKKDINNALEELRHEISEKEQQITFLQSFDWTKPVTEEEWHKICETPLRYSEEVLPVLVKNLFPSANNIEVGCNFVFFDLYDYEIQIPTSRNHGININTDWYHYISCLEECSANDHSNYMLKLKQYFEAKDQKLGWKAEAKARYKYDNVSTVYLFFWWFGCHKWQKVDRELFETRWAEEKNRIKERKKKIEQKKEENKNHILFLKNTLLPELDKFSTEHNCYVRHGISPQRNIDELVSL